MIIKLLNFYQKQIQIQNVPGQLFDKTPVLCFKPEQKVCPSDGEPLQVLKTVSRRKIKALGIGLFNAHHTVLHCPKHPEFGVWKSEELNSVVPPDANVAYSVIVEVGRLRFMENRQVEEIQLTLFIKHSVELSTSEIEILIEKFIFYLAAVHQESNDLINAQIKAQGGYILHIDGTCEGDSPKLISSMDSVSRFVLYSAKFKSENRDDLAGFMDKIKKRFGRPHAVVSDMGQGIAGAAKDVFGNIPHYVCHFHFLQAIGSMLFEKEHHILRKALSKAAVSGSLKTLRRKISNSFGQLSVDAIEKFLSKPDQLGKTSLASKMSTYYLILWILDHGTNGDGYGFPFDQRYLSFYTRMKDACVMIEKVIPLYSLKTRNDKIIWKLYHTIKGVVEKASLQKTVALYKEKLSVFSDLREALGSTPESVNNGLLQMKEISSKQELHKIERAVKRFMKDLTKKMKNTKDTELRDSFKKVEQKIWQYWKMLFADPIVVKIKGETKQLLLQRTNNIMERHFRQFNYGFRRIHGNHSVRRNLENVPEQLPLVENIKNPNYIKLVFKDETKIAERFAAINVKTIRKMATQHDLKEKIYLSQTIKRTLRLPNFRKQLIAAFAAVAS